MMLLCRVAENMFWLNRYVERALATIRVVDVTAAPGARRGRSGFAGRRLLDAAAGPGAARRLPRTDRCRARRTSATSSRSTWTIPAR